jgi:hypothetical protein
MEDIDDINGPIDVDEESDIEESNIEEEIDFKDDYVNYMFKNGFGNEISIRMFYCSESLLKADRKLSYLIDNQDDYEFYRALQDFEQAKIDFIEINEIINLEGNFLADAPENVILAYHDFTYLTHIG